MSFAIGMILVISTIVGIKEHKTKKKVHKSVKQYAGKCLHVKFEESETIYKVCTR